jgi:hypothetical protein
MNPKIEEATQRRATAFYGLCDKVITVASGLLAITVTFRTSLLSAVGGTIRSPRLLIVAWVALALTVATGLLTHFGHVQAQTQAIRAMRAVSEPVFPISSFACAGGLWPSRSS